MSRGAAWFVFALTAAFLVAFFFWPIVRVVSGAFTGPDGRFTAAYLIEVFRNPLYAEGLANSAILACVTTALVIAIGLPMALISAKFRFPGKGLLSGLALAPMVLPPFVGAIGLRQILGQYGALNALLVRLGFMDWPGAIDWMGGQGRFWAVAATEALHLYPIFYLNAAAAAANIDPAMEEAAENLGCYGLRRFLRITLPLMWPGVFAGGSLVFIWSFTELGTPLMFDYLRVTPAQIYDGLKDIGANPHPYALVVVMLAVAGLIYAIARFALGGRGAAMLSKGARGAEPALLRGWRGLAAATLFGAVFLVAVMPHVGVVLVSAGKTWYRTVVPSAWTLENFAIALSHGLTLPSIRNSLFYSGAAVCVDLALGIAIAYVIVRSDLPGRRALDALAMLPLAVPGVVLAFGYIAMSQPGCVFEFLNPAENPTTMLIVAYSMRRLPYMVRSVAAGLEQLAPALEEAARNMGASPLCTAFRITLPLLAANVLAGALLAFSFAMLEVSDSLMLAQREAYFPITKALFELSQLLGEGRFIASALGVWAMAFLVVTILLANSLLGKRLGTLFRI